MAELSEPAPERPAQGIDTRKASTRTVSATDLSDRQRRALAALLCAPTIAAAAKLSRTGERTLYRWLSDPTFREQYREHSHRLLENATGRLRAAAGEAVDTLREALRSENENVKVRSALGILDVAIRVDLDDLTARIEALEGLNAKSPTPSR